MSARSGLLLTLGVLLAGCGATPSSGTPFNPSLPAEPAVSCAGAPWDKCADIVRSIVPNAAGARPVRVAVTCVARVCNASVGDVSVEVIFEDGSRSSSGQGWQSLGGPPGMKQPPAPAPSLPVEPVCLAIADERCRDLATTALDLGRPPETVRSITVTCEQACTAASGSGTTRVVWDDGSQDEMSWLYDGGIGGQP